MAKDESIGADHRIADVMGQPTGSRIGKARPGAIRAAATQPSDAAASGLTLLAGYCFLFTVDCLTSARRSGQRSRRLVPADTCASSWIMLSTMIHEESHMNETR